MASDDFIEDDDANDLDKFSASVGYEFDYQNYNTDTFNPLNNEPDDVLAQELKKYYPELIAWPDRALATAWRSYSKDVGMVEEELICVRSPNLLGYLFVRQEKWPVTDGLWVSAVDAAIRLLWPAAAEDDASP